MFFPVSGLPTLICMPARSEPLNSIPPLCCSFHWSWHCPEGLCPALLLHSEAMSSTRLGDPTSSPPPAAVHPGLCVELALFTAFRSQQNAQICAGTITVFICSSQLSFPHDASAFDLLQICLFVLQTESYCQGLLTALGDTDCHKNSFYI